MYKNKTKKELKSLAKEAKQSGFSKYISLNIASEEELREYLIAYDQWLEKSQEREQREKDLKKIEEELAAAQATNQIQERQQTIASIEKKLIAHKLPLSEVGVLLAKYFGTVQGYEANVWTKNGQMRVYLKDISYTNPKDTGYVRVTPEGEIRVNFIRSISNELESAIDRFKSLVKVSINDLSSSPKRRTPDEIKSAIKLGENVSHSEVCNALDNIYGAGQWDDRDREDFEG